MIIDKKSWTSIGCSYERTICRMIVEKRGMRRKATVRREEYLDHMTFKKNERPLFTEIFGPMVTLLEEWEKQGAAPEELDFSGFRYRFEPRFKVPVDTSGVRKKPLDLIKETGEYILYKDNVGRTLKLIKGVGTSPLPLNYPVKNMDDWLKIKHIYKFSEERFAPNWDLITQKNLEKGMLIWVNIPGGFHEPRQLMGEEGLCMAYYEQPELVHDILNTIGDMVFQILDKVSAEVQIDMLSVHEDMAGKSGCLIGPLQIREFIKPYYRRIWDMLQDRGVRIFDQDSDGNMNSVIPSFLEAGVNCMHPMEPAAGMDIVKVREQYGTKLALYGGIDKHVLRKSKEEIIAELEYKIPPMVESGGCVLALDHMIPNGTPLGNYRFYINKVWEIIDSLTT